MRSGVDIFGKPTPSPLFEDLLGIRSQVTKRRNVKMPMRMLALMTELSMSTSGPSGPCNGSRSPQVSGRCCIWGSSGGFLDIDFVGVSRPPFLRLPLTLTLEVFVPVRGLDRTPALRAFTRSVAYVDCPSFAPFSIGPILSVN